MNNIKLIVVKIILAAVMISQAHGGDSFELKGNTFPPSYYTLIAPYNGRIDYMAEVGAIVSPIPEAIPPNGLGYFDPINFDYVKSYEKEARPVSLARLIETRPGESKFLYERSNALRDEFKNYNLKLYSVSAKPWDGTTPPKAVISKNFLDHFNNGDDEPFEFMKQQDASKELDYYNANGGFTDETKAIIESVIGELHFPVTSVEINEAVIESLIYLARGDQYYFYSVYPTPDTGDAYEPNNPLLIGLDGKIKITTSRGGRLDSGPVDTDPSLRSFCNYWKEIPDKKLMNHQDKSFLDSVNFKRYTAKVMKGEIAGPYMSHEVILSQLQLECKQAVQAIYEGTKLGTVINVTSHQPFSKNIDSNEKILRQEAEFWARGVKFDDKVFRHVARSFAIVAPYPVDPKKPYDFRLPPPAGNSAARVVNELRPSYKFEGDYLYAAERDGYLLLRKDSEWYDYNLKLWTLDVPLGGDGDNGEFFITANREARAPANRRFNDLERLYDIEVKTAIEISPAFVSVSRAESFDVVASALRQFEYSKLEAGRAIRLEGESIRKTEEALQEAINMRNIRYQYGYFFVPEDSVVVQAYHKLGDKVTTGEPLAMVQPIRKSSISFKIDSKDMLSRIYPGRSMEVNLTCDNYFEFPRDVKITDQLRVIVNSVGSTLFGRQKVRLTINSVVPSKDLTANSQLVSASLEVSDSVTKIPITAEQASGLDSIRRYVSTDAGGHNFLSPPGSIIPSYTACKLNGQW